MKITRILSIALIFVLATALLASCGNTKDENKLIGTWTGLEKNIHETFTFSDDGTGQSTAYSSGSAKVDFTYKIDGSKVTITWTAQDFEQTKTYSFKVDGSSLTFTEDNGDSFTLTKS